MSKTLKRLVTCIVLCTIMVIAFIIFMGKNSDYIIIDSDISSMITYDSIISNMRKYADNDELSVSVEYGNEIRPYHDVGDIYFVHVEDAVLQQTELHIMLSNTLSIQDSVLKDNMYILETDGAPNSTLILGGNILPHESKYNVNGKEYGFCVTVTGATENMIVLARGYGNNKKECVRNIEQLILNVVDGSVK